MPRRPAKASEAQAKREAADGGDYLFDVKVGLKNVEIRGLEDSLILKKASKRIYLNPDSDWWGIVECTR